MQDLVICKECYCAKHGARVELSKLEALLGVFKKASRRRQTIPGHFGEKMHKPCGIVTPALRPAMPGPRVDRLSAKPCLSRDF
jgi:hypothetical protein